MMKETAKMMAAGVLLTFILLVVTTPLHELGHIIIFGSQGTEPDEVVWLQMPTNIEIKDSVHFGVIGYVRPKDAVDMLPHTLWDIGAPAILGIVSALIVFGHFTTNQKVTREEEL